jgi:drug/metabolite transporter (DMT)-like permease
MGNLKTRRVRVQMMTRSRLVPVAAAVTVLLWASAFVVIRSAGQHFSPGPLALGRLVIGALALGVTVVVRREGWPPRAAWPGIVISGVLWFGVYFVTLNWGEQKVDAGTASMLVNVGPILIALLSAWLLKDRLPRRVFTGLAIAFAGAAVVGLSMSGRGKAPLIGVLLCLAAAVSYSVGVVAQKPALKHASALQVSTFGCAVGAICCLPFTGQLVAEVGKAPLSASLQIIYLGLFPTAIAFTTWAYALSHTTAAKMGATTYLVPAITVLLAWAFLGQVPPWLSFVGGAACLAGVAVTRSKRPFARRQQEPAGELAEGAERVDQAS